jgi:hypothetical protein
MLEWATFHGRVDDNPDACRLTAVGNEGAFTLPREAVVCEHGKISVKVGAFATAIKEPSKPADVIGLESKDGCSRTCSIGLVELCCDDGRIIGPCHIRPTSA